MTTSSSDINSYDTLKLFSLLECQLPYCMAVPSGGARGAVAPPINRNTRCKMAAKQENQVRLLALSPFTVRIDSDVQLSPFGRVNETTDLDQSHDADSEDSDAE